MKPYLIVLLLILLTGFQMKAQVSINADGAPPNASAMLDVKSSTSGLLPPRMTHTEIDAIASPANGLIIYCTDCGATGAGAFYQYVNGTWYTILSCVAPSRPVAGISAPSSTQVIWNWNAVSGANGYKWGTTSVYASATDMGTATTKYETGLTCNTAYTRYVWAYNACGSSSPVVITQSTTVCSSFTCGQPITINHVAGTVAPVSKTVVYGTVTNIPGEPTKCWITSNLGADHQATDVNDATEASAGWYWQFNRKQGYKHDGVTLTPSSNITYIYEYSDWLTINDPCNLELGTQWRLPTYTEWYNVDNTGGWSNWNGPWGSELKLHAAGLLFVGNFPPYNRGADGYYWCSKQNNLSGGWNLYFYSGYSGVNYQDKAAGRSVRCLREN